MPDFVEMKAQESLDSEPRAVLGLYLPLGWQKLRRGQGEGLKTPRLEGVQGGA